MELLRADGLVRGHRMQPNKQSFATACSRLGLTREEFIEQSVCFAYANAHMSNPAITEQMIKEAASEMYDSDPLEKKG